MSLGSVVRIILSSTDPLAARRAGYGRAVIGLGATAVTGPPARPDGRLREPAGIVARHAVEGAPRVGWDRFRSRRSGRAERDAHGTRWAWSHLGARLRRLEPRAG